VSGILSGGDRSVPKVSVIIPAYNCAAYLAQAIESVLTQSLSDYEVIVIDDASPDDTAEVAASFANQILYLRNDLNRGVSFSRNRGTAASTGEYLVFLDADDVLLRDKLASQVQFLDTHPEFGVAYSDAAFCDEAGQDWGIRFSEVRSPHSGNVLEAMCWNNFFPIHAAMVRRRCLDTVGWFEETYQPNEDWHLWLRLAGLTLFHYESRVLCKYRVHQRNVTHDRCAMSRANARVRLWLIHSPLFLRISQRTQQYCCLSCGVSLAKTGNMARARQTLRQAIRLRQLYLPGYALWLLALTGSGTFTRVETAAKAFWLRATGRDQFPLFQ
jgi:glycosyltransferase involved in cell wall biosynthesis